MLKRISLKLISSRSFIVYTNFLVLPIILVLLWLLLPIGNYTAFAGTSMVYFVLMFFTWVSFYDLNLPGVSKVQIIFFFLCFIGVAIAWLNIVTKLDKKENRLAYSFIDAIVIAFCALCYLIHIFIHKFKKQYVYQDETILDERGVKRRKRRSKPWTKKLSKILCYYKRIDMDEDDQKQQMASDMANEQRRQTITMDNRQHYLQTLDQQRKNSLPPPPVPPHPQNNNNNNLDVPPPVPSRASRVINPNQLNKNNNPNPNPNPNNNNNQMIPSSKVIEEEVDIMESDGGVEMKTFSSNQAEPDRTIEFFKKKKGASNTGGDLSSRTVYTGQLRVSPSVMEELMPKHELSFRNFFSVVIYQIFVIGTWFWLHTFASLVIDENLFRTPFLALVSIVVFHASRLILMGISNALNRLLKPHEIKFFTFFQFPLMFFLYYRNLFLSINSWGITVLVSLVLFLIDVIYYPLHMTKRYWLFRHQGLSSYLDEKAQSGKGFIPFVAGYARRIFDEPNPSYEQHVCKLSVEYYYDKMAEYMSIITMVVFLSLIRSLKYKIEFYPRFDDLTDSDFHQLLFRYLYLLGFEVSYDLAIRFFARRFMKIDISNRGRNETIANFTTRFIFTLFVIYDLMDVYNIQVVFRDPSTPTFTNSTITNSTITNGTTT